MKVKIVAEMTAEERDNLMNEQEYTRFFYWTRVFVKPAK